MVDSQPAETRQGALPAETQRFSSAFPLDRQSFRALLAVLLMTHQSSAVNSARSTVPPSLNLTFFYWYAEDSPPGSGLLISTVLLSCGQSNMLVCTGSGQSSDILWTV
jgi:hypothetical protein